jgi:hypothetical protein
VEPVDLSRRKLYAIRIAILAPLVVGVTIWQHPWPRHGLDRVRHAVHWPEDCAEVSTSEGVTLAWPHATRAVIVECEYLGPFIAYASFSNQADLRADLRDAAPWGATCITGNEVVIDGLDPGDFDDVCRRLHGDDIDGVAGIPDAADESFAVIETHDLRVRVAQGLALERYWSSAD